MEIANAGDRHGIVAGSDPAPAIGGLIPSLPVSCACKENIIAVAANHSCKCMLGSLRPTGAESGAHAQRWGVNYGGDKCDGSCGRLWKTVFCLHNR